MLNTLTHTRTLWISFAATIGLLFGMRAIAATLGFEMLDLVDSRAESEAVLNGLSDEQRRQHGLMTATMDVALPIAYGALLIGLARRAFGRFGRLLSLPTLMTVTADLGEGVTQITALAGSNALLGLKSILTPIKFGALNVAVLIAVAGLILLTVRRVRS